MRPERFELPAFWFVARRSIQLSYGRTVARKILSRQVGFGQNSSSHGKLHDSFCESWSARHACRQLSFVELDKVKIPAYEMLRKDCGFGQHMLGALLRGVSTREYQEVLPQMAATVGVSRSTISRKAVEASVEQLQQLQEGRWDTVEIPVIYMGGQ